ncbi:MAG: hypothetical protein JNM07_03590 [Phycisphaerae bacterium]|nr:hypothetical protein [Phycisphaerae bacterium]
MTENSHPQPTRPAVSSGFLRLFLPGLVIGLIGGLFAGSYALPFMERAFGVEGSPGLVSPAGSGAAGRDKLPEGVTLPNADQPDVEKLYRESAKQKDAEKAKTPASPGAPAATPEPPKGS